MWSRIFILLCLLPGVAVAQSAKSFLISVATFNAPPADTKVLARTITVERDSLGRVVHIVSVEGDHTSDTVVTYGTDRCTFTFLAPSGLRITSEMEWETKGVTTELRIAQENFVPEAFISGKKYPQKVIKKNRSLVITVSGPLEYSWQDKDDQDSRYTCSPGLKVVKNSFYPGLNKRLDTVLDGQSSDSTKESTYRMLYSRKGETVVGTLFWRYDSVTWDGKEGPWSNGGQVEYSGSPLNSEDPVRNVVNYSILRTCFQDAWTYFGPSLFGIPIR